MDCFESYEKWVEQFDLDDEMMQKLYRQVLDADSDFKKISQKLKYSDPVPVDLIISLERLTYCRISFATIAILKQFERTMARILYQISRLQEAQEKIQDAQDKQQRQLQNPS